jgi:hypothetical protein
MSLLEYVAGSIPVISQKLSETALAGVTALTTQTELLVIIMVEVIIVLYGTRGALAHWFNHSEYLSETIERVVLRFLDLFVLIAGFSVMNLLLNVAAEVYETSPLRINDLITIFFLLFMFIFLMLEKFRTTSPSPAHAT